MEGGQGGLLGLNVKVIVNKEDKLDVEDVEVVTDAVEKLFKEEDVPYTANVSTYVIYIYHVC